MTAYHDFYAWTKARKHVTLQPWQEEFARAYLSDDTEMLLAARPAASGRTFISNLLVEFKQQRERTLTLTERQLKDIQLAIYYDELGGHGSANHNWMMLVSKMAEAVGITMGYYAENLDLPREPMIVRIETEKSSE